MKILSLFNQKQDRKDLFELNFFHI